MKIEYIIIGFLIGMFISMELRFRDDRIKSENFNRFLIDLREHPEKYMSSGTIFYVSNETLGMKK